jgi:hypothetical protein
MPTHLNYIREWADEVVGYLFEQGELQGSSFRPSLTRPLSTNEDGSEAVGYLAN